jgi:hypothetical protein
MRVFCLTEAAQCELRVQMSISTPVIIDHHGNSPSAG